MSKGWVPRFSKPLRTLGTGNQGDCFLWASEAGSVHRTEAGEKVIPELCPGPPSVFSLKIGRGASLPGAVGRWCWKVRFQNQWLHGALREGAGYLGSSALKHH